MLPLRSQRGDFLEGQLPSILLLSKSASIKKVSIGPQGNTVDFGLQFGGFNETVTVQLTEKNEKSNATGGAAFGIPQSAFDLPLRRSRSHRSTVLCSMHKRQLERFRSIAIAVGIGRVITPEPLDREDCPVPKVDPTILI